MIKKVLRQKGFWKSVFVLSLVYALVFSVIVWGMKGFSSEVFTLKMTLMALIAGFIVALSATYGKFWRKLKEEEYRRS